MSATRSERAAAGRTPVQKAALVVGLIFLAVGVAGFIPGITTDYDSLSIASHHSQALLLGLFQVSILHNIVHLLFGAAGLLAARTFEGSRGYLIIGGAIYLVLFVYGLIVDQESAANFVPVNPADDILHLVLGVGMIGLGMVLSRRAAAVHRVSQEV
jgi:Domain of unknown function (DUF4383)